MAHDLVDYERLFFMLKESPMARPKYRSLKEGDKSRTPEQMKRSVVMNLAWADKLVPLMIMRAHTTASLIKQEIQRKQKADVKGLGSWR